MFARALQCSLLALLLAVHPALARAQLFEPPKREPRAPETVDEACAQLAESGLEDQARDWLARPGRLDIAACSTLIAAVSSATEPGRRHIEELLSDRDLQLMPALVAGLDNEPGLCGRLLSAWGSRSESAREALQAALEKTLGPPRRDLVRALAATDDPRSASAIAGALADRDAETVREALRGLQSLASRWHLPKVFAERVTLIIAARPELTLDGLKVLSQLAPGRALLQSFEARIRHAPDSERLATIEAWFEAFQREPDPPRLPPLLHELQRLIKDSDRDPAGLSLAARILAELAPSLEATMRAELCDRLTQASRSPARFDTLTAILSLGGDPQALVLAAIGRLGIAARGEREAVLAELTRLPSRTLALRDELIARARRDPDAALRGLALDALAPGDLVEAAALREIFKAADVDLALRRRAAASLARLEALNPADWTWLAESAEPSIYAAAIRSLPVERPARRLDRLRLFRSLLASEDHELALAAALKGWDWQGPDFTNEILGQRLTKALDAGRLSLESLLQILEARPLNPYKPLADRLWSILNSKANGREPEDFLKSLFRQALRLAAEDDRQELLSWGLSQPWSVFRSAALFDLLERPLTAFSAGTGLALVRAASGSPRTKAAALALELDLSVDEARRERLRDELLTCLAAQPAITASALNLIRTGLEPLAKELRRQADPRQRTQSGFESEALGLLFKLDARAAELAARGHLISSPAGLRIEAWKVLARAGARLPRESVLQGLRSSLRDERRAVLSALSRAPVEILDLELLSALAGLLDRPDPEPEIPAVLARAENKLWPVLAPRLAKAGLRERAYEVLLSTPGPRLALCLTPATKLPIDGQRLFASALGRAMAQDLELCKSLRRDLQRCPSRATIQPWDQRCPGEAFDLLCFAVGESGEIFLPLLLDDVLTRRGNEQLRDILACAQIGDPRPFLAALKDPWARKREGAAIALAEIGSELAALELACADKESRVREAALSSLGRAAARLSLAKEAIGRLRLAMADGASRVRLGAIRGLTCLGPEALSCLEELRAALDDPASRVREAAAQAIGALGPGAREAIPALCSALKDPESGVRREVCNSLAKVARGSALARDALAARAKDEQDFDVRGALERAQRALEP